MEKVFKGRNGFGRNLVLSMKCLHAKCKRVVTVDDVFRFLDSDEHELTRYTQKVVDSYMFHNKKRFNGVLDEIVILL